MNHRMRPARFTDSGDRERSGLLKAFGRRVDQLRIAVLITKIQMAISIRHCGGACRALGTNVAAPPNLAGQEFDADRESVAVALPGVNEIIDQHESAMVIMKCWCVEEIYF